MRILFIEQIEMKTGGVRMYRYYLIIMVFFIKFGIPNTVDFSKGYIGFISSLSDLKQVEEYSNEDDSDKSFLGLNKILTHNKNVWLSTEHDLLKLEKLAQTKSTKTVLKTSLSTVHANIKNYEKMILSIEKFLNSGQTNEGTLYKNIAESAVSIEKNGQNLFNTTILFAHILVDEKPDNEGKMSFLIFDTEERDQLKTLLLFHYGNEVKYEAKKGMSRLFGCASMVYKMLDGEHKSKKSKDGNKIDQFLERELINALSLKNTGAMDRISESNRVIKAYIHEGIINYVPNKRLDYTDFYLVNNPAKIMGHDLIIIEEEYLSEYIGCCVDQGIGVQIKINENANKIKEFARINKCSFLDSINIKDEILDVGIKMDVPVGRYASLSCRYGDANRPLK